MLKGWDGELHGDMSLHFGVFHRMDRTIHSQQRTNHEPVQRSAVRVGGDIRSHTGSTFPPVGKRFSGFLVEVRAQKPWDPSEGGQDRLDLPEYFAVVSFPVRVGDVVRIHVEDMQELGPGCDFVVSTAGK